MNTQSFLIQVLHHSFIRIHNKITLYKTLGMKDNSRQFSELRDEISCGNENAPLTFPCYQFI